MNTQPDGIAYQPRAVTWRRGSSAGDGDASCVRERRRSNAGIIRMIVAQRAGLVEFMKRPPISGRALYERVGDNPA
jgi:hypothetical protein